MEEDGDEEEEADAKQSKEVLDYDQYYPTLLPMRPRHASLDDDDERAEAKPPDLENMPVRTSPSCARPSTIQTRG